MVVHVSGLIAIGSHFSRADVVILHCTAICASTKRTRLYDTDDDIVAEIDALETTTVSAFETTTEELSTIDSTDLTRTMSAVADIAAVIVCGWPETNVAVAFAETDAEVDAVADASTYFVTPKYASPKLPTPYPRAI